MIKLFIVLIAIIAIITIANVKVVPQGYHYVIEFLGKYQETWDEGLHIKIPFFQAIRCKVHSKETVADFPPQAVITKDNVSMQIDSVVYYKIMDEYKFAYGVDKPIFALENLAMTTLRNIIGAYNLDETLTARQEVNDKMAISLDKATDDWGIKVTRVELKNIMPPKDIQTAMEKEMRAEREKREAILIAEAKRDSTIFTAEGEAKAKITTAEANAKEIETLAKAKANAEFMSYQAKANGLNLLNQIELNPSLIKLKNMETLAQVADGKATKLIVPTDLSNIATDLTIKGDLLGLNTKDDYQNEEYHSYSDNYDDYSEN